MTLIRYGLLLAGLIVSGPAWAQYAPFNPPGGIDPATCIGPQTTAQHQAGVCPNGQKTLAQVQAGASASVDLSGYLTTQAAADAYATLSALDETDSVAHAAQATANAAVQSATLLDGLGHVKLAIVGDVTGAPVTPAGSSPTTLGAYLGLLAKSSDLSSYLTVTAAGQTYATQTALAATTGTANAALAGLSTETTRATGAESALQGNINTEAATRANADAGQLSGGLGMGDADKRGLGLHLNAGTGNPNFWYADGDGGKNSDLAWNSSVQGVQNNLTTEASARANADALLAPKSYPSFVGNMTLGRNTDGGVTYFINSAAGTYRQIIFQTAGISRWSIFISNSLEPGSNVGADVGLSAFADNGSYLFSPLIIARATGVATFYAAPKFPTAAAGDNSTNAATTAGVRREIATGYTVAALPTDARRYTGARGFVTDATACTFLGSLTGGGSTFCPVIYNGTAWIAE